MSPEAGPVTRTRGWWIAGVCAVVIAVAVLWQHVFVMTGVSRWQEPTGSERPAPPPPVDIEPLPTGWVDLEVYQQTHPFWNPW
jgi:hypothetical protein